MSTNGTEVAPPADQPGDDSTATHTVGRSLSWWPPPSWSRTPIAVAVIGVIWLIANALLPNGAPVGEVLAGAILGSATGLTAVGIILIWRANRIINFANGAIAGLAGVFAMQMFLTWELPWVLSLVTAPVLGFAVGALVEFGIVRRFATAPRLVLTVATIGLAQLLGGLEFLLPKYVFEGSSPIQGAFETPLSSLEFEVGPALITGNHLLILGVVPVVVGGLAWFLKRSLAGTAVRAAAENTDRARLLGVPVRNLTTLVWAMAGAMAALTFILQAPILGAAPTAATGPAVLLPALAAAIVARMESMPVAFGAAVALGVMSELVRWNTTSPTLVDLLVFGVILIALLVGQKAKSRAHDSDGGWQDAELIRKIAPAIARLPIVRIARKAGLVALVAAAVFVPMLLGPSDSFTASIMVIWALVAVSLVVLTGWGGQISLGQFAIVGASAIVAGNLFSRWDADLFLTLAAAVATGAAVSLLLGVPALRIKGPFLAVVTLAFAVVLDSYVLNPNVFPEIIPQTVVRPLLWGRVDLEEERYMLWFSLACLAMVIALARGVRRSRSGRLLIAARDNRKAAEAAAVPTRWVTLSGFVFSGGIAGLAGGLHVLLLHGARAGSYQPIQSIDVFSMATIGGLGSIGGAITGAAGLRGTQDLDATIRLIGAGIGVLVVLWLIPSGLAGLAAKLRDLLLRRVAARHGMDLEGWPLDPMGPEGSEGSEVSERDMTTGAEPVDSPEPASAPPPYRPVEHPTEIVAQILHANAEAEANGQPLSTNGHFTNDALVGATSASGDPTVVDLPIAGDASGSNGGTAPAGPTPLLRASDVDVSYGQLQVLFGVDLDVAEGEIVALLGTNGAGKSTILKAICGLAPSTGSVTLDGETITKQSAEQIVRSGIALMPGGRAIFPTVSVADHLRLACWTFRNDAERIETSMEEVYRLFPVLSDRKSQLAGDLSGGEQQQLALAMTLLLRPRVLLIDELSLGLSPMIVSALCDVVRELNRNGMTVIVVEQSVNVALTLAQRAVFMEKGTVRFVGPTRELLERPDLLRSVFIEGAGSSGDDEVHDQADEVLAKIDLSRLADQELTEVAPNSDEPVLVCRNVTKRFGGVHALSDVDLIVGPGEVVGLIGQNGAGKTTLMDCISGFHPLDTGSITFRGIDISGWEPHQRAGGRMGRTFQEARLFPSLTVAETISVACERHVENRSLIADATRQPVSYLSEDRTEEQVRDLVGLLGLDTYAHTPVAALSTGTRRIVELACLLAEEPVLMLLDEPSAGVAQRETEALGPLLRRISDHTGAAMLVIEHDMPLLAGLCDRLIAMELGQVLVEGTPADVLDHPAVIAAYLGTDAAAIHRSGVTVA